VSQPESSLTLDFGTLLGPLFYTWLFQLLLPVMLVTLVYEKERRYVPALCSMQGSGPPLCCSRASGTAAPVSNGDPLGPPAGCAPS
jgi:hypothetical protein